MFQASYSIATIALTAGLLFSARAQAQTELTYKCELTIAAADLGTTGGVFNFTAPITSGSHGGTPKLFKEGVHTVQVIADAQWMGVSWSRAGTKIAEAVFVLAPMDRTLARVGILYDPSDSGDQVSLNCSETPHSEMNLREMSPPKSLF